MICVTTMVTSDHYQYYIPLFLCSLRKYYPEVGCKIFVRGESKIKGQEIIENTFTDYPKGDYVTNALRFNVDPKHFKDYEYVYYTDIDFIFLPQKKPVFDYLINIMKDTKLPYAGHRGPIKARRREKHGIYIWDKNYSRLAAGVFMVAHEWFKRTTDCRKHYLNEIKKKKVRYREYDEVMLYHFCKLSGFRTPIAKEGTFVNGKKFHIDYRHVHLGDFKFGKRYKNRARMKKKFLTDENVKKFTKLEKEDDWKEACEIAEKNKHLKGYMKNLRGYARKICL